MSNANLPYTRFTRSGGSHISAVSPIGHDDGSHLIEAHDPDAMPYVQERMTRRRRMEAGDARDQIDAWTSAGAVPIGVTAGWRAWQRERRDATTGGLRVQRLAVADGAGEVDVVNWSVPSPVTRGDEQHFHALLDPRDPDAAPGPSGPVPFMGWTA